MPEIDNGSSMPSMSIQIGDDMKAKMSNVKNAAPSSEAQPHIGEKPSTAQTNTQSETSTETAQEAVTQTDAEDFVSGRAKARKLGESRRKLAKSILDGATASPEARDNFKKLVQEDKDLDKYFQKHFPAQYHSTINGSVLSETSVDEQSTRAKILAEEIRSDQKEEAYDLAVQLKFTEDEAEQLEELFFKLQGSKIGGKELDDTSLLQRCARIIRPDKAKAGITNLPSSRGLDDTKMIQTQAKNEQLVEKARGVTGYKTDTQGMMKNLEIVDQGYDAKNRRFVMPEQHM